MKSRVIRGMRLVGVTGCALLAGCRATDKTVLFSRQVTERPIVLADKGVGQASFPAIVGDAHVRERTSSLSIAPVAWERELQIPPIPNEVAANELPQLSDSSFLGLNELLNIAVEANPTLRQAQSLIQQAQGNWSQVALCPNPTLEWHDEANNAPFDAHYASLSQDIVTGGKLKLNQAVASHDIRRAQWEAEAQHLRVLNEVQIRYVFAWSAQRQVAVVEELLKNAEEGLRVSERMWRAEEVSEADVLQARLQLNDTSILLRNAQVRAIATWKQLANVIGRPMCLWPVFPDQGLSSCGSTPYPLSLRN